MKFTHGPVAYVLYPLATDVLTITLDLLADTPPDAYLLVRPDDLIFATDATFGVAGQIVIVPDADQVLNGHAGDTLEQAIAKRDGRRFLLLQMDAGQTVTPRAQRMRAQADVFVCLPTRRNNHQEGVIY